MKLEDLKKLFGEAIDKADFVVNSVSMLERVEGVSLRLDSDGVMSLIFHVGHTKGRTETSEALHFKNAMELYEHFGKATAKELDGSFLDWETLNDALDDYKYWKDVDETEAAEIPDRISALLKDRNALAEEIETLKKKIKTPKPKEEPKAKKVDTKPAAVKSEEAVKGKGS